MVSKEEFVDQVADAYEHLYDIVYLRTHALAELLVLDRSLSRKERAWQLHHLLLDVIDELDPGPQAPAFSRVWRRHRLMVLRYTDGLEPQAVADRLAISRRTYYREHEDAILAIASLLCDDGALDQVESQAAQQSNKDRDSLNRLELLRLEAARLSRVGRGTRLPEVIEGAVQLVQGMAEKKSIRIRVQPQSTLYQVGVDRSILRQILLGALGYLVGCLESGKIWVRAVQEGDEVLLSLEGQGIRSAGGSASDSERQVLLSTLSELATMQEAQIHPITDRETVTGFRLVLPTVRPRTILVVDDNEDALLLFQRYLSQHRYQVITAQTGAEAIALAKRTQPYAITLDLMMPDQDGWDVLQTLTNQPETRHIPVIVCTVLSAKELALSLGATFFLEKPITEQTLLSALGALEGT